MSTPSLAPSSKSSRGAGSSKAAEYTEPIYQVKLLAALRNGDTATIQSFLSGLSYGHGLGQSPRRQASVDTTTASDLDLSATALHLAIRCAPVDIVQMMLSHRAISPNAVYPLRSKTTPLHLAASLGRADVVELLLEQADIDDTARDEKGRTCKEVARNKEVQQVIQESQSLFQSSYRALLRTYISSSATDPTPSALNDMLKSPRARLLDLSYLDDGTGTTLLHEAAKRKDLRLVELAIQAGADVFVRDRKGKTVGEGAGKDDRVKVFLRQFTNQDTALLDDCSVAPPTMKGFLNKYTNVAKGYNPRWFVLKDGVLSYYRHREDEDQSSRGSIAMSSASVKLVGHEKNRFEVYSNPSNGKKSVAQRWYIKANHPSEASKWLHALQRSAEWSQDRVKERNLEQFLGRPASLRTRESKRGSFSAMSGKSTNSQPYNGGGQNTDAEDQQVGGSSQTSLSTSVALNELPPHSDTYELHANAVAAQADLVEQLFLSLESAQPHASSDAGTSSSETSKTLLDGLASLRVMIHQSNVMSREREEWWQDRLTQEKERAVVWEESLGIVVREGEVLERELRNTLRSKKAGSRRKSTGLWDDGTMAGSLSEAPQKMRIEPVPAREGHTTTRDQKKAQDITPIPEKETQRPQSVRFETPPPINTKPDMRLDMPPPILQYSQPTDADTEEEDEFFDAIESNNLPGLVTTPLEVAPEQGGKQLSQMIDISQYRDYEELRERMPIGADNRPAISLWSVLKNNIGKDLTKISFPVTFNEPTSMLQRMAEDMEFSECLDAAAAEEDPLRRIAFVAAFAMSNYSSTIGRIAKPFNPMLGETFEYVSLDKHYRYMSEQVSHHPPISACWAEAPSWHYFGEVDAQNKFMGKSFEIRPTGVAHAELILPEKWGPGYPKATGDFHEGKVVEHYTWKKVTTNVSGFILGSPTIDHYGEMTVVNHRTKDKCILTFKPRGWRGKDAYEINGRVIDPTGRVVYEIAGRWNSQLVARQVGTGIGSLLPDVEIDDGTQSPGSPSIPRYILLWRNTDKPKSPFNLTPFAITLNDIPGTLKRRICPTDCRLRPDQRAFESGKYELANILKIKQEEFQRATRKKRDEGHVPPHQPRWFTPTTDTDSRERVWAPSRLGDDEGLEYWNVREAIWKESGGVGMAWPGVENIFIEPDLDQE